MISLIQRTPIPQINFTKVSSFISAHHSVFMNTVQLADKIFSAYSLCYSSPSKKIALPHRFDTGKLAIFDLYGLWGTYQNIQYWITPAKKGTKVGILSKLAKACFTFTGVVGIHLKLQKWNLVNLASLTASIGKQSQTLNILKALDLSKICAKVGLVGATLSFGDHLIQALNLAIKISVTRSRRKKAAAQQKLNKTMVNLALGGINLATSVIPMLCAVSPLTLVGFAIISKGTGICSFFILRHMDQNLVEDKQHNLLIAQAGIQTRVASHEGSHRGQVGFQK